MRIVISRIWVVFSILVGNVKWDNLACYKFKILLTRIVKNILKPDDFDLIVSTNKVSMVEFSHIRDGF